MGPMRHPWLRTLVGLVGMAAMLGVAGCPFVLVGAGAVGGYAVSRDRVDLTLERPYDQV